MTQIIQKQTGNQARDILKTLSQEVYDLVESGTFESVNDALMETKYKDGMHKEFKSYRQWNKAGLQIRKGEKPFLLWARPKDIEHFNSNDNTVDDVNISQSPMYFQMYKLSQLNPQNTGYPTRNG